MNSWRREVGIPVLFKQGAFPTAALLSHHNWIHRQVAVAGHVRLIHHILLLLVLLLNKKYWLDIIIFTIITIDVLHLPVTDDDIDKLLFHLNAVE